MKILILGAAGELAGKVTEVLMKHTDASLILYARNAGKRLHVQNKERTSCRWRF
jgi:N-acetyl-gamma-glutamylphosphate reductase